MTRILRTSMAPPPIRAEIRAVRPLHPSIGMRGISLIEVTIATALMTTMALGVAPLLASAVRANATARLQFAATTAASERMEDLLAAPFADALSPADALTVNYPDFSDIVTSAAGTFVRRWSITQYGGDPADTRVFSVRVTADGRPPLVTLTTIRTRTGP
jgi:type II secretory pathway pseudopilin PulG